MQSLWAAFSARCFVAVAPGLEEVVLRLVREVVADAGEAEGLAECNPRVGVGGVIVRGCAQLGDGGVDAGVHRGELVLGHGRLHEVNEEMADGALSPRRAQVLRKAVGHAVADVWPTRRVAAAVEWSLPQCGQTITICSGLPFSRRAKIIGLSVISIGSLTEMLTTRSTGRGSAAKLLCRVLRFRCSIILVFPPGFLPGFQKAR
jgi:hypothetical protein